VAGDFLLQSREQALEKRRAGPFALHLASHLVLLFVVVVATTPSTPVLRWGCALVLVAHAILDGMTSRFATRSLRTLVVDQFAHLAVLGLVAVWVTPQASSVVPALLAGAVGDVRVYAMVAGFITCVWAGAVVVERVVGPLARHLEGVLKQPRPGLLSAGRTIGLLERTLVFVAVLLRLEALVGLVIAAKAILRLPEAREAGSRELSEYYLVGSLASISWAVVIVVLVRWIVQGRP
jgi:hypothetical protein